MTKITIELPFPISTNAIWRSSRGRVHISAAYKMWKTEAGILWITQKRSQPAGLAGAFWGVLWLNREQRGGKDVDNYSKCVLDFCKAHRMIVDDKLCEGILTRWGDAPSGARLILRDWRKRPEQQ